MRARDWLFINLKIGALSFGGSGRIMLYQDALVKEKQWLSEEEFFEILTVAQLLPGPNLVNLAFYSSLYLFRDRASKFLIACAAILGLALPGTLLVLPFLLFVNTEDQNLKLLFQGMSFGSIALFLVFTRRLFAQIAKHSEKPYARYSLVFLVALASLAGVPLLYTLSIGLVLALLLEFAWPR